MTQESLPILYSFKRCPYAIRARMALAFSNIDYLHREIDLKNKHPHFLKTSPKGTVPVFVCEDGKRIIDESYDLVLYALQTKLPQGWEDHRALEHPTHQRLYHRLTAEAIPAIRAIKYDQASVQPDAKAVSIINRYLEDLDRILAHQRFLLDRPSCLDLFLFPNLRQLIIHDDQWLHRHRFSSVHRWLQCWTSHPIFKKVFVTQPVWHAKQTPIVICNQHGYHIL